jgi:hypothetical protein
LCFETVAHTPGLTAREIEDRLGGGQIIEVQKHVGGEVAVDPCLRFEDDQVDSRRRPRRHLGGEHQLGLVGRRVGDVDVAVRASPGVVIVEVESLA